MADGFFSKAAGQDRRKRLNEAAGQFVPPELRKWMQIADMMNPVSDIGRAGQSADKMMDPNLSGWDRAAAGGDMLVDMASVVAPAGAAKMAGAAPTKALMEGLFGWAPDAEDAVAKFGADESGALKLTPRGGYAGSHTAPNLEAGATLDNPIDIFGDDIYGRNALQYFGTGDARLDRESIAAIQKMRNNPAAEMDIYRAMPKDAAPDINAGDWVTTSKKYADDHGKSALDGNYQIVKERVRAGELATDGNSVHEWGWWPDDARKAAATPTTKAQQIAAMLSQGRAGDVTDDLMAQADPSELWRLYQSGATGADMPMDAASRMARAEGMGFDTGTPLYHGGKADISAVDPAAIMGGNARGAGFYMTDNPAAASGYADGSDMQRMNITAGDTPNVMPLTMRGKSLNERATLSRAELDNIADATDGEWSKKELRAAFDRGYPAQGQNVAQTLSYKPDEQNAILKQAGYEGRRGPAVASSGDDVVSFNPTNIRSRFARFDPRLKHLANLSAAGAGVAYMGGQDDNKAQIRAWLEGQR